MGGKAENKLDELLEGADLQTQEPEGETLASAAQYWEFDKNPIFEGQYIEPFLRPNDDAVDKTKKAGDLIGYRFKDKAGNDHIIGSNYYIENALEKATEEQLKKVLWIKFEGKKTLDGGRQLSMFKVKALANGFSA